MARLIHPTAGTVVTVEGNLEDRYRAAGWAEPDSVQQDEATSEKPKPVTRRTRKPRTAE